MEDIKIELIIAAFVNFWILFFLFKHFLWERLATMIEWYRQHIKQSEEADEIVRQKMEKADKKVKTILSDGRKKAKELEKTAIELTKHNSQKIIEWAEQEAEYILEHARSEVQKEKLQMEQEIEDKILELTIRLNARLFQKEKANKDFIEKELKTINI